MARKSKLTTSEIEAAEVAADDRKISRGHGFDLMSVRDRGWAELSNGVRMAWHTTRKPAEGEAIRQVPLGKFLLMIDGKELLFDVDDFQKLLRWA